MSDRLTRFRPARDARLPRMVRLLAATFSHGFRARFGGEMLDCIHDARRALGDAPFGARARFWTDVALDLARAGMLDRARSGPRGSGALRLLCAAFVALAMGNVLVDAMSEKLQMGIGVLLFTALGLLSGVFAVRPRRASAWPRVLAGGGRPRDPGIPLAGRGGAAYRAAPLRHPCGSPIHELR